MLALRSFLPKRHTTPAETPLGRERHDVCVRRVMSERTAYTPHLPNVKPQIGVRRMAEVLLKARSLTLLVAILAAGCAFGDLSSYDDGSPPVARVDAGADGARSHDATTDARDSRADSGAESGADAAAESAATMPDAGHDAAMDAAHDAPTITTHDAMPDVVAAACDVTKPFGAPTAVTELDSTAYNGQAALSPDLHTVYFTSTRSGTLVLTFTASRAGTTGPFGAVSALGSLNFNADTWNATITGDGNTAYYVTDLGTSGDHMYKATRSSSLAGFSGNTLMPAPIVSGTQPFVVEDGSALYYTDGSGSLSRIARADLTGSSPTVVDLPLVVPSGTNVGIPAVNASETVLYFSLWTTYASYDIWASSRATASDPWGTPALVSELSSSDADFPSWVSPDDCMVYLTRAAANGDATAQIFVAVRPP
jgi:hypothetical protein